ncbi:hypothetical protein J5F27_02960 [Schleiferilactobacillus harbinensis]|uniref:RNA polymerase sigma factor n=1 Tax=Schleiferilactobacillus harbinensis TaxID=304207 RepID=UPI001AAF71AF|nr:sigma factor [Schleiferilactobacillus harbinensis]MBO3090878.1 hypothetical protein [Schleiferilactobacillus harbinensis]
MPIDETLIAAVIAGDSEALEALFQKYLPLVNSIRKHYFVRLFDDDDWYQEARLCCYQSCCRFDGRRGSKFGGFFKYCFTNHVRGLVRREMAAKRKGDADNVSLEQMLVSGKLQTAAENTETNVLDTYLRHIPDLWPQLSGQQQSVWQAMLQGQTVVETMTPYQFRCARAACREKLTELMTEDCTTAEIRRMSTPPRV